MPRPNVRLLLPLVLAVAGGVWGFNRWSFAQAHESTDNAQVDGHIVPVVAKVGGFVLAVAYMACRRTKRNSTSARAFEARLEHNLLELHDDSGSRFPAVLLIRARRQGAAPVSS